jgi:hypothetical protein
MADQSPFHSTYPRSGLPIPIQPPSYHLSSLSTSGPLSIDNRVLPDERPLASSSSSRHQTINNVSSLLNHQAVPRPIVGLPSPENSPPLLGVVPSHNPPVGPITTNTMSSRAGTGRLESPSGPSGSRQDQDDEDSKGHKKRTRLNSDQGALLKKVWREVSLVGGGFAVGLVRQADGEVVWLSFRLVSRVPNVARGLQNRQDSP